MRELGLSIGQVAERTGLTVHALRFYEREGLLVTPVQRGPEGHRVYTEWDLEWLEVCQRLRESGMPLTAIRHLAELVRQGEGNEAKRLELLREHQQRVRDQIRTLGDCLDLITWKIECYEGSLQPGAEPFLPTMPH